jgi:CMP-N,N'-diacetyllegionaminic acid synthase
MKIVSLIPARGGSKGIPRKNLIDLNGKPLLYYTINASLWSDVNETWVSSDDDEILNISKTYGAKTIKRPKELSGDIIMPDEALLHFANQEDFDILVFIQPTSPLINTWYINKGIEMIKNGGYDSVFTATKEHWIPKWDKNVNPIDWDTKSRPRRQDKPDSYVENGMFYITKRKNLIESKLRYSGKIGMVEIPLIDSFQLDSAEDLELIRKIL